MALNCGEKDSNWITKGKYLSLIQAPEIILLNFIFFHFKCVAISILNFYRQR